MVSRISAHVNSRVGTLQKVSAPVCMDVHRPPPDEFTMPTSKKKHPLKDPKGALTAAGRKKFEETEGASLKPGVKGPADTPQKMRRKGSFLRRHFAISPTPAALSSTTTESRRDSRYQPGRGASQCRRRRPRLKS
jgi:hypothetical protein